jgi:hypothetical protein
MHVIIHMLAFLPFLITWKDPLLVKVEDVCEDPTKVRDEVKR